MITDFIVNAAMGLINIILGLVPNISMPDISSVEQNIYSYMEQANRVFPVDTFIYVILGSIAVRLALQLWDLLVFVYHQFWGSD